MTYYYYKTNSWTDDAKVSLKTNASNQISESTLKLWKRYIKKKNWRITQLPNGYYQAEWIDFNKNWTGITRRETIEGAEKAIESSIEHYTKKLKLSEGPVVVKTF
jgi:hypothetical protein